MESDLNIFNGMEGFEDFSGSDDSLLVALLDDLQEETLMTLLSDNLFAKEVCDNPFEKTEEDSNCSDKCNLPWLLDDSPCNENLTVGDSLVKGGPLSSAEITQYSVLLDGSKRERSDSVCGSVLKRVKVDSLAEQPRGPILDRHAAVASVMHDHCYALSCDDHHSPLNSNTNSDEETSNEEGSNSDTGMKY